MKILKKLKIDPFNHKKLNFQRISKVYFLMIKGPINPKITSLGEKLWLVAWRQKFTSVIQSVFFLCVKTDPQLNLSKLRLRSSLLHIVVWSLRFCYIPVPFFWVWDAWSSCSILSNKNAQIENVTNITSEKHTLLDLFVAMDFDDRIFFRDGIEEHICYTCTWSPTLLLTVRPLICKWHIV